MKEKRLKKRIKKLKENLVFSYQLYERQHNIAVELETKNEALNKQLDGKNKEIKTLQEQLSISRQDCNHYSCLAQDKQRLIDSFILEGK